MSAAAAAAGVSCWRCGAQLLEWGRDFLGRTWCLECAWSEHLQRIRRGLSPAL